MSCLLFLLLVSLTISAAHKTPIPAELMQAKTVYIKSFTASYVRDCSDELSKWGRFKIVSDPKGADVIFYIGSHSSSNGSYTRTGNVMTPNSSLLITVEVVQASSQKPIWSGTQAWSPFRWSPTRNIVKDLRKRIEEQEKTQ